MIVTFLLPTSNTPMRGRPCIDGSTLPGYTKSQLTRWRPGPRGTYTPRESPTGITQGGGIYSDEKKAIAAACPAGALDNKGVPASSCCQPPLLAQHWQDPHRGHP